jgi:hypothetical protein
MEMPGHGEAKLPKADANSILQRRSIAALERAFPADKFVLRPEPPPDAGVDQWLELLIDGQYTGMRSHVQLKSCISVKTNLDGSISFQADVSNLEYLRYASSSLYILYIQERGELRYIWVRDEIRRIAADKPNWAEQSTLLSAHLMRIIFEGSSSLIGITVDFRFHDAVVAIECERRSSDSFSWAKLLLAKRTIRRPVSG